MARILMTRALDGNGHIVDVKDVVSQLHMHWLSRCCMGKERASDSPSFCSCT